MDNRKPYFHQIVFDDYIAHRVRIPPLFMKHLSKDMSDKAAKIEGTIKVAASSWPVKLRKTSKYTYIEDGWPSVMEDNALGDNEFLLFRYEGDMCFNLQIFEKTGCERIYPTVVSNKRKDQQDDYKNQSDGFESLPREMNATMNNLENPHFKMCMKEYNVERSFILRIPREFATRLASGSERMKINLENSKGESWEVNACFNSGSYSLSGGWRNFVIANKLKVGNECIFELLNKNRFKVHIITA